MDCVNHPGVNATAYCQNCGKAMCAACARQEAGGQILCEPCWRTWQSVRTPFAAPPPGGPNPVVAAVLGLFPGVGAMYNGQFLKGFIHVAIFAVLVSMADHYGVFGLFIAAWIVYQVFEAYHTAKARRDGEPLPDPLGFNELTGWFHAGMQSEFRRAPIAPAGTVPPATGAAPGTAGQAQQPAAGYTSAAGAYVPYAAPYQGGYQPPLFTGVPPAAGYPASGYGPTAGFAPGYPPVPPMPPASPMHWRRREPVAAIILIGMGVLFLMGQWDWFSGRLFEFTWPVLLIGLGVWLVYRRTQDLPHHLPSGPPFAPGAAAAPAPPPEHGEPGHGEPGYGEYLQDDKDSPRGGSL